MSEMEVVCKDDLRDMSINEIKTLNLYGSVDIPGVATIGDYLIHLLFTLWDEKESFSGKRPFGNSGWEYDLYQTLLYNNLVVGEYCLYDDDGAEWIEIHAIDDQHADKIVEDCILEMK